RFRHRGPAPARARAAAGAPARPGGGGGVVPRGGPLRGAAGGGGNGGGAPRGSDGDPVRDRPRLERLPLLHRGPPRRNPPRAPGRRRPAHALQGAGRRRPPADGGRGRGGGARAPRHGEGRTGRRRPGGARAEGPLLDLDLSRQRRPVPEPARIAADGAGAHHVRHRRRPVRHAAAPPARRRGSLAPEAPPARLTIARAGVAPRPGPGPECRHRTKEEAMRHLSVRERFFVSALGAIVAAGAAATTARAQDAARARPAIEAANEKFSEAVAKGDAAALAAMYTTDAEAFPPSSDVVKGRAAIEKLWKSVLDSGIA